jgi:hypothetical protein
MDEWKSVESTNPESVTGPQAIDLYRIPDTTLERSHDVCKGSRFPIEGEQCVHTLFKRLDVNEKEEEAYPARHLEDGWSSQVPLLEDSWSSQVRNLAPIVRKPSDQSTPTSALQL